MTVKNEIISMVHASFADVQYPGDWCLRGSNEGDEPYLLEEEFKGKTEWQSIDPAFLDQAPAGFSSALSFFSDEAFRFYLPAYIIADINQQLGSADPAIHLCSGLADDRASKLVNPRRYGSRTWRDVAEHKFAVFSASQAAAIVAYLKFLASQDEFENEMIDQALRNYWLSAADEKATPGGRPHGGQG